MNADYRVTVKTNTNTNTVVTVTVDAVSPSHALARGEYVAERAGHSVEYALAARRA